MMHLSCLYHPVQMAQCTPPHYDLHPMRVLFLIPKSQPPQLQGSFSEPFKDFVFRYVGRLACGRGNQHMLGA